MTIQQGQCTIFKQNCLSANEDFSAGTPYVYKMALYNANADLSFATLEYTTVNEVSGTGYTAGGKVLVNPTLNVYDQTAYVSFDNITWVGVSFTCRGALIYNSTTNAAVAVINFGSDKTAGPNFTVTFPTNSYSTAIIRFS